MDKSFKNIIMNINKWFKKKMISISLAFYGVEKNAFGQNNGQLDDNVNQERRHTQGTLADSLKEGKITQETLNLKWRTYKIIKATDGLRTEITGYDDDGMPITKTVRVDKKISLRKISVDSFDTYDLEMVLDNSPITTSGNDIMSSNIELYDEIKINDDDTATHGEISGIEYFAKNKNELPITILRETLPKFELETYTKKLNVRIISDNKRLLEFYISKYVDEDNRTTRLFISDIKKTIENPRNSTILDIKEVGFITYKTIGIDDFLEFQYKILSFDKIIEFNGHYVVKFIAEVIINGRDILEEHKQDELELKYKNKEKKKQ